MLRVDLYDLSGNRVGNGPLRHVVNASVSRVLDGIGSVSISVPMTDERAIQLLQNERRVRIYVQPQNTPREIGRGIVRNIRIQPRESGSLLIADGPDDL